MAEEYDWIADSQYCSSNAGLYLCSTDFNAFYKKYKGLGIIACAYSPQMNKAYVRILSTNKDATYINLVLGGSFSTQVAPLNQTISYKGRTWYRAGDSLEIDTQSVEYGFITEVLTINSSTLEEMDMAILALANVRDAEPEPPFNEKTDSYFVSKYDYKIDGRYYFRDMKRGDIQAANQYQNYISQGKYSDGSSLLNSKDVMNYGSWVFERFVNRLTAIRNYSSSNIDLYKQTGFSYDYIEPKINSGSEIGYPYRVEEEEISVTINTNFNITISHANGDWFYFFVEEGSFSSKKIYLIVIPLSNFEANVFEVTYWTLTKTLEANQTINIDGFDFIYGKLLIESPSGTAIDIYQLFKNIKRFYTVQDGITNFLTQGNYMDVLNWISDKLFNNFIRKSEITKLTEGSSCTYCCNSSDWIYFKLNNSSDIYFVLLDNSISEDERLISQVGVAATAVSCDNECLYNGNTYYYGTNNNDTVDTIYVYSSISEALDDYFNGGE